MMRELVSGGVVSKVMGDSNGASHGRFTPSFTAASAAETHRSTEEMLSLMCRHKKSEDIRLRSEPEKLSVRLASDARSISGERVSSRNRILSMPKIQPTQGKTLGKKVVITHPPSPSHPVDQPTASSVTSLALHHPNQMAGSSRR